MGANVPDVRGRVLWGDAVPGKALDAGLPNVSGGAVGLASNPGFGEVQTAYGALRITRTGIGGVLYYNAPTTAAFDLDASRSSAVYGRSTTVQPPALTARFLIRARP